MLTRVCVGLGDTMHGEERMVAVPSDARLVLGGGGCDASGAGYGDIPGRAEPGHVDLESYEASPVFRCSRPSHGWPALYLKISPGFSDLSFTVQVIRHPG